MIEIKNLCKSFGEQEIFNNFSLKIDDGEFVIISGASGSGKSTLLNMIGLLEEYDSGEIKVDGFLLSQYSHRKYWREKVGFLFQNFALIENKTVFQNLEIIEKKAHSACETDEALERVGMLSKKDSKVYTLSGGEQQRVALARLYLKKCDIILADEPTGSLDRKNADMVLKILLELNEAGKTVLLVTHDETIKELGKRVVEL